MEQSESIIFAFFSSEVACKRNDESQDSFENPQSQKTAEHEVQQAHAGKDELRNQRTQTEASVEQRPLNFEARLATARDQMAEAQEQARNLVAKNNILEGRLETAENQKAEAQGELRNLHKKHNSMQETVAAMRKTMQQAVAKTEAVEAQMVRIEVEKSDLSTSLDRLKRQYNFFNYSTVSVALLGKF